MHEEIPAVGTLLGGQYRLTEIVGEGGMGVIYRARQEPIGRDVAVKVLRARYMKDENVVSRFENEAKIISQLRHPNTLRLYDTQKTSDGRFFIVTEFLQGQSLEDLLSVGGLPAERVIHIADQIAASLCEAHENGIVHRDLKPANIFLDRVGSEDHVKVLDFGIAKLMQGAVVKTQANIILGTPGYMSPEQVKGGVADARSDIYSLGILIYQMLAGDPPFHAANPVQLLVVQVEETPPPLPKQLAVPPALSELVFEMLAKEAKHRPQTVSAVRERFKEIARTLPDSPSRPDAPRAPAMKRAEPRAASMKTMPFDALDQVPTAAWERPGSMHQESTHLHADPAEMMVNEREPTITVPIDFEEPIELEQAVGLELFLDESRPEAIERPHVQSDSEPSLRAWILVCVGLVTAALVYYFTVTEEREAEDASHRPTSVMQAPGPATAVPPAMVVPEHETAVARVDDMRIVAAKDEALERTMPRAQDARAGTANDTLGAPRVDEQAVAKQAHEDEALERAAERLLALDPESSGQAKPTNDRALPQAEVTGDKALPQAKIIGDKALPQANDNMRLQADDIELPRANPAIEAVDAERVIEFEVATSTST